MATHAETKGPQGTQGPAGPAPTDSGRKVLATPNDGSSGVSALRRLVAGDISENASPTDGYVLVYETGDGKQHFVDPGSISGISAIKLRGVSIASGASSPSHGQQLEYNAALSDWELKQNQARRYTWFADTTSVGNGSTPTSLMQDSSSSRSVVASDGTEGIVFSSSSGGGAGTEACLCTSGTPFTLGAVKRVKWRYKPSSAAAVRIFLCLTNAAVGGPFSSDDPSSKLVLGFRFADGISSTLWYSYSSNGSTSRAISTGVTVDTTAFHDFEIFIVGTTVYFLIDGVLVETNVNTSLPASSTVMRGGFFTESTGAAAKTGIDAYFIVEFVK